MLHMKQQNQQDVSTFSVSDTSVEFKTASEHVQVFVGTKVDAEMTYNKFLATKTKKFHAC